jgi:hypothetical protein
VQWCNRTVLTVITHKLLLHVQLHNSTAHTVYKYCTNCTVCNWTVLTVITHKLLLHVQLHNSTTHLLYKYCTNCTVCNWAVLTVITQKILVQYSAAQRERNCPAYVFWNAVQPAVLNYTCISTYTSSHAVSLELTNSRYCHKVQCHLFTAPRHNPNCSSVWNCMYIKAAAFICFKFMVLAASVAWQWYGKSRCYKDNCSTVRTEGKVKYLLCEGKCMWNFSETYRLLQ